eukprot:5680463-Pyramimonas_sp.AAC.1
MARGRWVQKVAMTRNVQHYCRTGNVAGEFNDDLKRCNESVIQRFVQLEVGGPMSRFLGILPTGFAMSISEAISMVLRPISRTLRTGNIPAPC